MVPDPSGSRSPAFRRSSVDLRVCVVTNLEYSRRRFDKYDEPHVCQRRALPGTHDPSNTTAGVGEPGCWVPAVSGRVPGVKSVGADRAMTSSPNPTANSAGVGRQPCPSLPDGLRFIAPAVIPAHALT